MVERDFEIERRSFFSSRVTRGLTLFVAGTALGFGARGYLQRNYLDVDPNKIVIREDTDESRAFNRGELYIPDKRVFSEEKESYSTKRLMESSKSEVGNNSNYNELDRGSSLEFQ